MQNINILREHDNKQTGMAFVCIEELLPKDHLLRKIDRVIDFDFIRGRSKISTVPTMVVLRLIR